MVYHCFQAASISDTNLQPCLDDCIDSLGKAEVITALNDLRSYKSVRIKDEHMDETTFLSYFTTNRRTCMSLAYGIRLHKLDAH